MIVAAVDQGTTLTKCLNVHDDGQIEHVGAIRHRQIYPRQGWVEHDPEEILWNVRKLITEAVKKGARAVALANQGETVVAWDRNSGRPLGNAIVWQDTRTADAVEELQAQGHERLVRERAGVTLDSYFSASKLAWLLENSEGARGLECRSALGLGTSDAFLLERLTGAYATDAATASRTSLMSLSDCSWDADLCALFNVPAEQLPVIRSCDDTFGAMDVGGTRIPVIASIVDQQAALYGHGCRAAQDSKVTFGTGAFALTVCGPERPQGNGAGPVQTLAWLRGDERTYAMEAGIFTAGAAVEWLMRLGLISDLSELAHVSGSSAIESGTMFVPALAGLGCPHWERRARALWVGLELASNRETLVKAVLEGVALLTAETLAALGALDRGSGQLSIDGGLVRCPYFVQFVADSVQRRVFVRKSAEITALGVAAIGLDAGKGDDGSTLSKLLGDGNSAVVEPARTEDHAADWRSRFRQALEWSRAWPAASVWRRGSELGPGR